MKKFRIRPDYNITEQVWTLDEKIGLKWKKVMRHQDLDVVKRMKDHLLKDPVIYTTKNNIPEQPLRKKPSTWVIRTKAKLKRLKIKRSELPPSLQ